MKLIVKISKSEKGRTGECLDGTTVSLVSPRSDGDIRVAVKQERRHPHNIWKVMGKNRYYPLGCKLGEYFADKSCAILFPETNQGERS